VFSFLPYLVYPGEKYPVTIEWKLGRFPEMVLMLWRKENLISPTLKANPIFRHAAPILLSVAANVFRNTVF
jgi:hypothetical protein